MRVCSLFIVLTFILSLQACALDRANKNSQPKVNNHPYIKSITTPSGRPYEMDDYGLDQRKLVYTDRTYVFTEIPDEIHRAPYIRVANGDDRSLGDHWLSFESDIDLKVLVGVDTRNKTPLNWMQVGDPNGFSDTGWVIKTNDAQFRLYRKKFPKGKIVLGGNTNQPSDSGRGNYIVVFQKKPIPRKIHGNPKGFSFREENDTLEIYFKKQHLATYLKRHPKLTRRAFVNVKSLNGTQVTRNFPPIQPEDDDVGFRAPGNIIHPFLHPGLWLGFADISGNDYWRLKAKVQFEGFVGKISGNEKNGSFKNLNRYLSEDGKRTVCDELTTYQFEITSQGLLLRINAEYHSKDRDFYFGDQEEAGLALRVASPIRVRNGNGTILNDQGSLNEKEVRGQFAKWFDYFGNIEDRQVGVMIAGSPENPKTTWLHARDYGLVATNPFPMQPVGRREPFVKTWVKKGEVYKLSYIVLIHDQSKELEFDRDVAYQLILKRFSP